MLKPESELKSQETRGKTRRLPTEILLLLFLWFLTSGFCLLLCNYLVTALCQAGIHGS
jgi:hypothetical protein